MNWKALQLYFLGILIVSFFGGCEEASSPDKKTEIKAVNQFSDQGLTDIYEAKDRADLQVLGEFLQHEKATYRAAAALALGSVRSKKAISQLLTALQDSAAKVRKASAFSLGQLRSNELIKPMQSALDQEAEAVVVQTLFEALGKCGDTTTINYVLAFDRLVQHSEVSEGKAMALYRLATRGIHSEQGTAFIISQLANESVRTVEIAAHYLARARGIDLNGFVNQIATAYKGNQVNIQMPLAQALSKAPTQGSELLKEVLANASDYRILVNAIRAAGNHAVDFSGEIKPFVTHENPSVGITAAAYFTEKGKDASQIVLELAESTEQWRVRAALYQTALANEPQPELAAQVRELYQQSEHIYERGALLLALAGQMDQMTFIIEEMQSVESPVLKSYAMEALAALGHHADFEFSAAYAEAVANGVASGDVGVIAQAAQLLTYEQLPFRTHFEGNSEFLKDAQSKLPLPAAIEAYLALRDAIDYFEEPAQPTRVAKVYNHPIDWERVKTIRPDQKASITTEKGTITLQLFVEEAPGSVLNFIQLTEEGYFNDKNFHRIVPNFVAQGGCPRGDGWGSPNFTIRTEIGYRAYKTGSVGMASAGPDTESSQWFICHSATPHLDGNYTIFAEVVEGMDVVHQLEVGDKIKAVNLLD